MSEKKPGRIIFLGDIPYDITEVQVAEIAKTIGPITNVRLVTERDSNKSRGFAFVEYMDINSAIKAVNALNGQPLGQRTLRADFSNEATTNFQRNNPGQRSGDRKKGEKPSVKKRGKGGGGSNNNNYSNNDPRTSLPPPPPPTSQPVPAPAFIPHPASASSAQAPANKSDVPRNLVVNDNISRTLSQFPPHQLLQVIKNMKLLTSHDPVKASEILHSNTHMTYALLQALLLMGLVDKDVVAQAVQGQPAPRQNTYNNNNHTPPPPPPPPPAAQPLPSDPQQAAMIQQVLALTEEQINSLQPQEKQAIIAIREQYGKR